MSNESNPVRELDASGSDVLLTPGTVDSILVAAADTDTLSPLYTAVTEEEAADGVIGVECVGVSKWSAENRPEAHVGLSGDFKGAVIRLQHRPTGDTTQLEVDTYFGDPKSKGPQTSEHHQEVFVFDADGRVIRGHNQVVKIFRTFADHPKGNSATEVIVGEPIEGEELVTKAAKRAKDVKICVDAGI